MNPAMVAVTVLACLLVAMLLGNRIGRSIPELHLSAETRDTVKLATGLVATMAALLLGLLISSAKGSHDARRGQVIQMASKISAGSRKRRQGWRSRSASFERCSWRSRFRPSR